MLWLLLGIVALTIMLIGQERQIRALDVRLRKVEAWCDDIDGIMLLEVDNDGSEEA
jgi:hypothetical protein